MPIQSALDIANCFIEIASKIDENDLTNLKLQKLLYFAQGKYLVQNNEALFSDEIEAWDLGPVVRSVYNTFRECGAFPITAFDVKYKSTSLNDEKRQFLKKIWQDYARYSASYLVNLSHQSHPWQKAHKSLTKIISSEDMRIYFRSN
jgi:uncharacterized phage-associated protein